LFSSLLSRSRDRETVSWPQKEAARMNLSRTAARHHDEYMGSSATFRSFCVCYRRGVLASVSSRLSPGLSSPGFWSRNPCLLLAFYYRRNMSGRGLRMLSTQGTTQSCRGISLLRTNRRLSLCRPEQATCSDERRPCWPECIGERSPMPSIYNDQCRVDRDRVSHHQNGR
jgi:hypothetical protein